MSTSPQPIDPSLIPAEQELDKRAAELSADQAQIAADQQQESQDQTQFNQAEATIASLKAQIAALTPVKHYQRLERSPWLIAPGTAANSNPAAGSAANIIITLPTDSFSKVTANPLGPYGNKYAYKVLLADPTLNTFRQYGSIYFPTAADAAASQAWEADLPQKVTLANGRFYFNWGMQYDFAENMLRVWNKLGGTWVPTGKPMPRFQPGTWVDHAIDCHREGTSVIYDQLTIGGVTMLTDVMDFAADPIPPATASDPDILNYGLQPDGDKAADKYSVCIDNFGLICWSR
ncbi:MAG TPA: hypothetical protein VKU42_13055 [Candidatus Angelobacter sp.]|nr:hypothetical protein [Candidatus Angelobacter sp.]